MYQLESQNNRFLRWLQKQGKSNIWLASIETTTNLTFGSNSLNWTIIFLFRHVGKLNNYVQICIQKVLFIYSYFKKWKWLMAYPCNRQNMENHTISNIKNLPWVIPSSSLFSGSLTLSLCTSSFFFWPCSSIKLKNMENHTIRNIKS